MEIREVMTESVVTAPPDAPVRHVAELMRERNVGSVVLIDGDGLPIGFITDRDLAVSVLADGHPGDTPAGGHASSPVVTGAPGMDVTEATKLMVDNGVRRLPIVDGDKLTGIVTLDDLAVRIGDLEIAAQHHRPGDARRAAGLLLLRPRRLTPAPRGAHGERLSSAGPRAPRARRWRRAATPTASSGARARPLRARGARGPRSCRAAAR